MTPPVGAGGAILVVGGSGFVGRHVVNRLVEDGRRVIVPTRRRENAGRLHVLPTVDVVEADVHRAPDLLRLAQRASAVINLVGILNESGANTFARAHVELARNVVAACKASGVPRLVHMSALNADPAGAEQATCAARARPRRPLSRRVSTGRSSSRR